MINKSPTRQIQNITKQLIRKYKPEKIILFGSAAYDNFGPESDLDLLVIKKGIDNIRRHERYCSIRKLLPTNIPIDVFIYTPYEIQKRLYIGDPFIKNIISDGKVLYGT